MWIKTSYNSLILLSEKMCKSPKGSLTKYAFGVQEINGYGYCEWTQEIENAIDFEYEIVSEPPTEEEI